MRSFLRNLGQIVIADQQTVVTGLVVNPDGSEFSEVVNVDSSYTVYYEDAQGDTTAFQYGATEQLTGSYHTTSNDSSESEWSGLKPRPSRCALRRPQRVRHSLHRSLRIMRLAIKSIACNEYPENA